jgi:hypothetical protein
MRDDTLEGRHDGTDQLRADDAQTERADDASEASSAARDVSDQTEGGAPSLHRRGTRERLRGLHNKRTTECDGPAVRGSVTRRNPRATATPAPLSVLCATAPTSVASEIVSGQRRGHHPQLIRRPDGRYEVRCRECLTRQGDAGLPIGIGVPIANRAEAEMIARNHQTRAA